MLYVFLIGASITVMAITVMGLRGIKREINAASLQIMEEFKRERSLTQVSQERFEKMKQWIEFASRSIIVMSEDEIPYPYYVRETTYSNYVNNKKSGWVLDSESAPSKPKYRSEVRVYIPLDCRFDKEDPIIMRDEFDEFLQIYDAVEAGKQLKIYVKWDS